MKLMIASDIHGSAYYCDQLLKAYQEEKADKLLLLGDILYHGPRNDLPEGYNPKKVIAMLNDMAEEILCVRGNCDTEVDQMVLKFPILAEYCILYLENHMIFATHGHKLNEDTPPLLKRGDILLNGHTHIPKCTEYEDFIYINPGSVSIPKEDSPHSYLLLENNRFQWKELNGNCYKEYKI
ncbi:MAG: phosphodiesterase [Clostridiales bacterium]|jgi:putative phosphoesterase|nr:phosphodiesterase [Clostridiales bacterium]